MKNIENWRPSKFKVIANELYPNINKENPSHGSWLGMKRVCEHYNLYSRTYIQGKLIDLGCGEVPFYHFYENLVSEITTIDWGNSDARVNFVDYEMDLNKSLDLASNSYDTILLADVLEHIRHPEVLIQEMSRILKPGGHVVINLPFMYCIHDAPYDYFRYTNYSLKSMFEDHDFEVKEMHATGGSMDIITDLVAKIICAIPFLGNVISLYYQKLYWLLVKVPPLKQINQKTKTACPFGYFGVFRKKMLLAL